MRTDRIITIYISIDRERIDKRVRELTSIMGTPINKLDDEDTNGYGLAIEADLRYRRTRPSSDLSKDDTGYLEHEISPLHYGPKGIIYSIIVPHPTAKSRLELIWADAGYSGQFIDWVNYVCGWILQIVKRSDNIKGFQVLPRRWVVELTFGWLGR